MAGFRHAHQCFVAVFKFRYCARFQAFHRKAGLEVMLIEHLGDPCFELRGRARLGHDQTQCHADSLPHQSHFKIQNLVDRLIQPGSTAGRQGVGERVVLAHAAVSVF